MHFFLAFGLLIALVLTLTMLHGYQSAERLARVIQ